MDIKFPTAFTILFVLVIGGFLMVVTRTGAFDSDIGWLLRKLQGREILMIPILMTYLN